MNFWKDVDRPIKVLSPMAGYTDSAFRVLCREFGADVVITELISADAIAYGKFEIQNLKSETNSNSKIQKLNQTIVTGKNTSTAEMLSFCEEERPLVVQLFGKYPAKFGIAAKWVTENLKPDGIDINMGCPARKVVNSDHGAALLKNPDLAIEIVKAVKENTDLPVSVKTRLGWDNDDQILEFAPKLASAGIDALIVHGRTYKDGFKGKARWENIYKVKALLPNLTVVGNGDIDSIFSVMPVKADQENNELDPRVRPEDDTIGLDGYAIGRATFGKPWIFSKAEVSKDELKVIILRHAKLVYRTKGDYGMVEFRKHLLAYLKDFPGAKELRKKAVAIKTLDEVKGILELV
ncbi:MAG: tRNA-dihydrouridine synthase family protein [Patescibacteria group bacterium]